MLREDTGGVLRPRVAVRRADRSASRRAPGGDLALGGDGAQVGLEVADPRLRSRAAEFGARTAARSTFLTIMRPRHRHWSHPTALRTVRVPFSDSAACAPWCCRLASTTATARTAAAEKLLLVRPAISISIVSRSNRVSVSAQRWRCSSSSVRARVAICPQHPIGAGRRCTQKGDYGRFIARGAHRGTAVAAPSADRGVGDCCLARRASAHLTLPPTARRWAHYAGSSNRKTGG